MNANPRRAISILLAWLAAATPAQAWAASEEERLLQIAKRLKPINDSQWNEIAGSKVTDTYELQKGDTLWDVSKRLFGNSYYWPKVWAFNGGISNPHIVAPGEKLVFNSGSSAGAPSLGPSSGTEPGSVGSTNAAPTSAAPGEPSIERRDAREYDKLPPDRYAPVKLGELSDTKNYDEWGFDREIRVQGNVRSSLRVPGLANDTTIPYLGEIVSSRRDGVGLSESETVFLKSNSQDLQVGTSYTIFEEPEFARERRSDRSAYVYRSIGEVRIVGVKDELYIGVITKAYDVIKRGMKVYPLLPLVPELKPVAARSGLEALVVVNGNSSTRNSGQFHYVHFDRGIEDGVQIGNVFRIYDYFDPLTKKKISDADFLINADAIVIHATAQFSTALVLRAIDTFTKGDFAVLLTDVSEFEKTKQDLTRDFGADNKGGPEDKELDELDELDRSSGEGLGKKEEAEIKELDHWDKTKDQQDQAPSENLDQTVPAPADKPTDEPPSPEAEQPPSTDGSTSQDPTLDQTLDSPTVTPPGLEPSGGASSQLKDIPEQPSSDEGTSASPNEPNLPAEPIVPTENAPPAEIPAPSDSSPPAPAPSDGEPRLE